MAGSGKDSEQRVDQGLKPPSFETYVLERTNSPEVNKTDETIDLSDDNDDDLLEYELSITDEERKAGEYALLQMQEQMTKKKEEFQKWSDKMTTRRLYALSRSKKLEKYHKERMEFYVDVGEVLKHSKVENRNGN